MAVPVPAFFTLKANIKTMLETVAAAEKAVDAEKDFTVSKDRWRPWIENQQDVALVNVMIDAIRPEGGSTRFSTVDKVSVNVDMYVLGLPLQVTDEGTGIVTLYPSDEKAAERLDLLINQVRFALTRMLNANFGFSDSKKIQAKPNTLSLQIYTQEGMQESGNYAPARWTFDVLLAFNPEDDAVLVPLSEVNLDMQLYATNHTYPVVP